jgi:hypothetical protein
MTEFNLVWEELLNRLVPGTKIRIWNPYNGYLGEDSTIVASEPDFISINPPRVWESQQIPRHEFKLVWDSWPDYLALRLQRQKIHNLTEHSKYIISILHWYETEC